MTDKLDKIDVKILNILQENSKITNLELSKKIGLSPAPTLERVKKLEQTGVIESYHAKINAHKVNLAISTFILVNIAWNKPKALDNFMEKIKKIEEIVECFIITGDADVLMKVVTKDMQTYEALLFKKLSQIEEVERLKTLMNLSTIKQNNRLPIEVG
ncbi:MAG: Lrp/AsnC family transcriptional regulator [Saprospiraceae bacterium]|jgi:Lrp/AsnC family transcriptional regulator, leucine-responsive regulatory protein|uniref:Lrp/AsnC family transcriptional regulator n=1 Tax=Candidatus Defluviibacterium haderslevense TaxID=2981993 RepID=A0A9D7S9V7_9BACT|nr:Lrp/AsnC family transcriptional regulator [Candidatus Defluviibacterium haderslevense]MCC7028115.1 Lrp/AsnC family transcriptional regulator [Saprospiraceae bacterium]MBK7243569.1 Lrp/AsnC family transcriptional regulator [Candidatus Defluviibacterium haderslevense]MBK8244883.1 Lrp/AsnC family transcriptional regulator [Candidatus Defluviibacterium haderslevense]MBK9717908.1 Lrp/AsnC family transcriptional regulator [Candidatus Defluviibacterium haderslevense]